MGDVFAGRYELVDPLGEGGAGVVWRAWDRREGRYVAAKVLRQVDASSLMRFIREQGVRIEHPHVLTPLGWAGEDDKVLFTLPIVRGGSVATLIGDFGPLPPRLVAVLLDQLLSALEQIHAQGVVHRDVKPANLLLEATGQGAPHLWLSDFGIAAAVDEPRLTHGPVALGTVGYLAPECQQPGWDPDPRADLYAAGMCAVEMATGLRPTGLGVGGALDGTALPDRLAEVIRGLGEFDPARRTVDAALAREHLATTGLLGDAPAEAHGEVEVFDQVPALPTGWGAAGPVADATLEDAGDAEAAPAASSPVAGSEPPPAARRQGLGLAVTLLVLGVLVLLVAAYLVWG